MIKPRSLSSLVDLVRGLSFLSSRLASLLQRQVPLGWSLVQRPHIVLRLLDFFDDEPAFFLLSLICILLTESVTLCTLEAEASPNSLDDSFWFCLGPFFFFYPYLQTPTSRNIRGSVTIALIKVHAYELFVQLAEF